MLIFLLWDRRRTGPAGPREQMGEWCGRCLPPAALLLERVPCELDLPQRMTAFQTLTHILELCEKAELHCWHLCFLHRLNWDVVLLKKWAIINSITKNSYRTTQTRTQNIKKYWFMLWNKWYKMKMKFSYMYLQVKQRCSRYLATLTKKYTVKKN